MKKKFILISIILFLFFLDSFLFFNYIYVKHKNKLFIEKYEITLAEKIKNNEFIIDKVLIYSSASGINKNVNFQQKNWILDIFQYSDIAIYFKAPKNLTGNSGVKELSISNFSYITKNNKHPSYLYFLNANNFGKDIIDENYQIENSLEYTIINFDNSDNSINTNTPVFFSDLSNPITLKFVHFLAKNHIIENNKKLIFDGTLLNHIPIKSKDLETSISFDINITNFQNEKYSAKINLNLPIENNEQSILNGNIYEIKNMNLIFLQNN